MASSSPASLTWIINEFSEFVQDIRLINPNEERLSSLTSSIENETDADPNDHCKHIITNGSMAIHVYIKVLEGFDMKISVNSSGFQIIKGPQQYIGKIYETMESLLSTVSPLYREAFSMKLIEKLQEETAKLDNEDEINKTIKIE